MQSEFDVLTFLAPSLHQSKKHVYFIYFVLECSRLNSLSRCVCVHILGNVMDKLIASVTKLESNFRGL